MQYYWTNIPLKNSIDGKIKQRNFEVSKGKGKYALPSHFTLISNDIEDELSTYMNAQNESSKNYVLSYDFREVSTKGSILVRLDRIIFNYSKKK